MFKYKKIWLILLLSLVFSSTLLISKTIVVVVNKKNPIDNITTAQLRRIFLGEQKQWDNGKKVFAINLATDNPLRKNFQKAIIGMTIDEIKKYWMDQKIKGKSFRQPNVQKSIKAVQAFVKKLPIAISYLSLEDARKNVHLKILKVDGQTPEDDKYILK